MLLALPLHMVPKVLCRERQEKAKICIYLIIYLWNTKKKLDATRGKSGNVQLLLVLLTYFNQQLIGKETKNNSKDRKVLNNMVI